MTLLVVAAAAAALGLERVTYVWVWRHPDRFRALCARPPLAALGEPVEVLRAAFLVFKVVQGAVFAGWWWWWSGGAPWPPAAPLPALLAGGILIGVGQVLNASVFRRLGTVGVFYGTRFGHDVPWCRDFPFTVLRHPQYVGTVLSIWGLFLVLRYPHADWMLLPAIETAYYAIGARLEQ